MYKLKIFDIVIAVVILIASFIPVISFAMNSSAGKKAFIYSDNILEQTVDLVVDADYKSGNMVIRVKDGKIRVVSSDCPRQICVRTGWAQKSYQAIVCLPNKVLIEIKGDEHHDDYDAVVQ